MSIYDDFKTENEKLSKEELVHLLSKFQSDEKRKSNTHSLDVNSMKRNNEKLRTVKTTNHYDAGVFDTVSQLSEICSLERTNLETKFQTILSTLKEKTIALEEKNL